jgi:hypothetical protein
MNSLIFLQGSAMGGGFALDTDRLTWMGWKALALVAGGIALYFLMNRLWPGERL